MRRVPLVCPFGIAALALSCAAPTPRPLMAETKSVASAPAEVRDPPAASPGYPLKLDLPSGEELSRRTMQLSAETPGWTILLDPFGMLSVARCEACGSTTDTLLSKDDRAYVASFLAARDDIVRLGAPSVVKQRDDARGMFFSQVTAAGVAGSVSINRFWRTVQIQGHMWPDLPSPEGWLSHDVLESKLRALDDSKDLFGRGFQYVWIRRSVKQPIEMHEAACSSTQGDVLWVDPAGGPRAERQLRPCVDARTGEDLTPLCVSWSVMTSSTSSGGQTTATTTRTLGRCTAARN